MSAGSMQGLFRVTSFTCDIRVSGHRARWTDDDSSGVAGPYDEPTMPKGAQGSGRRPGASRRDECASRPPRIGVTAPQSGHPRVTRAFGRMGAELKFARPKSWWNLRLPRLRLPSTTGGTFDY